MAVAFSSLPGEKLQTKRKDTKEKTSVSFGAEGETRQGAALSVRCANDPILCPFLLRKKMDGSVLVSPGWDVANKKKRYQGKSLIPFGAEGETRTLAPVARPTPLAGAPRHHLSTSPKWQRSFFRYSVLCTSRRFLKWRRRWDSNPRNIAVQRFSRPPP